MRKTVRIVLLVINILSFVSCLVIAAFFLICEFIGYDKGNDFLKMIKFPLSDNGLIWLGLILTGIYIILFIVRKKCFGETGFAICRDSKRRHKPQPKKDNKK
ncbi:MAG: hypothetical protein LBM65_03255 [Oscillospiraceae bacterium]|nr:hypothetical protein [Oscillospiraceae bacterium]